MRYLYKSFLIFTIVASFLMAGGSLVQADPTPYTYSASINGQDITEDGVSMAAPAVGGQTILRVEALHSRTIDKIQVKGFTSSSGIEFYVNGVQNKGEITLNSYESEVGGTEGYADVVVKSTAGFGGHVPFSLEVAYYANGSLQTKITGKLVFGEQASQTGLSLYPENKEIVLGKAGDFVLREWVVNNASDDPIGTVNLKYGYSPNPRNVNIKLPTSEPYKNITVRLDFYINDSSALNDPDIDYTVTVSNTTTANDLVLVTPNPTSLALHRGSSNGSIFSGFTYLTLRVYRNASVGNYPISFNATYDSGRGEFTRSETITIRTFEGGGSWQPVDLLSPNAPSLSIVNDGAYNIQNLSLFRFSWGIVNPYIGKFALLSGLGDSATGDPGVFFQPDGYSPDTVRIRASYEGNTTEGLVSYTCPYCVMFDGKQNDVVQKGNSTTFKVVRKDLGNLYTTSNWNWAPRAFRNGVDVTGTEISFTNVYSNGATAFFTVTPTNTAQTGGRYKLHLYTRTLPNLPNYEVPQFANPNTSTTVIAESIADLAIAAPTDASITGTVTNVNTQVVRPSANTHTHTLTLQKQNISSTSLEVSVIRENPAKGNILTSAPPVRSERISSTATQDVYAIYVDAPAGTELEAYVAQMKVSAVSTSGQAITPQTYNGNFSVIEVTQPSFSFTISPANKEVTIPDSGQTARVSYNIFVSRTGGFPSLSVNDFTILLGLNDRNISVFPSSGDWSVRGAKAGDHVGGTQPDFVLDIDVPSDAIATPESGDTFSLLASKNGVARSASSSLTIKEQPTTPSYSFTLSPTTKEIDIPQSGTARVSYNVFVTRVGGFPPLSASDFTILLGLNDRNIAALPPGSDWNVQTIEAQSPTGGTQPDFVLNIDVPSDAIATPESGDTFHLLASKNSVARSASSTLVLNEAVVTPTPSYSFNISPSNKSITIPPTGQTEVVSYDVFVNEDIGFPALTTSDFTALFGLDDRGIALISGPNSWYMTVPKRAGNSISPFPDFTLNLVVSPDAPATPVEGDSYALLAVKNGVVKSATSSLTLEEAGVPQNISLTITPDNRNVTVPTSGTVSTTYDVSIVRPSGTPAFDISALSVNSLLPGITGAFSVNGRTPVAENEQRFILTLTIAPNTPGSSTGTEDTFNVSLQSLGDNVATDSSKITLTKNVVTNSISLSMPAQKNIKNRTLGAGSSNSSMAFPITAVRTGTVGTLSPENFSLSPSPLTANATHAFTNTSWSDCESGSQPSGSSCHLVTFTIPPSVPDNSYPFTVTASRSGVQGSAQSILNIGSNPPPPPPLDDPIQASLSVNPSTGNAPVTSTLTLAVTDPGTPPYTYAIDANGDGTWDSSSSSYQYTYGEGSYTAIGRVVDALGMRATSSVPVIIGAPVEPLACTLSATKTEGIVTFRTQFTLSATGGIGTKSYVINPGDGRPSYNASQHTHDYRTAGDYTAIGTVSDASGNTSCQVNIKAYSLGGGETNPGGGN